MTRATLASALTLALALASAAGADPTGAPRPDAHAPIGVMGDHMHSKGEFMLSYRYMRMRMDDNLDGTDERTDGQILVPRGDFLVTPTDMNMQMHMMGAMWAPFDRITLMGMLPYIVLDMDHVTATGQKFTTRSQGIGDISVTALVRLWENEHHHFHLNAGVSFPTGSIDRKDDTPASMGKNVILPYPMQLGSGTVDLLPGLTYTGKSEFLSWGGQALGNVHLGRNDENYRLGNSYLLTGWGAWKALDWFSLSGRVAWEQWLDIQGQDDRIPGVTNPMVGTVPADQVVPTADPNLRAGQRLDVGPSVNFIVTDGPFKGVRFAVEAMFPAYQNLDGPQLQTKWTLTTGIQYAF
jgi:hypothetical protein